MSEDKVILKELKDQIKELMERVSELEVVVAGGRERVKEQAAVIRSVHEG